MKIGDIYTMLSEQQKISFFLPIIDFFVFLLIAFTVRFLKSDLTLFTSTIILFMLLMVVFNFYSARFQNRSTYFISVITLIIVLNICIIILQFSLFERFIYTKTGLLKINGLSLIYLYIRRYLLFIYLKNNRKNIYILSSSGTEKMEYLIKEKASRRNNWYYMGVHKTEDFFTTVRQNLNKEETIVLINNLTSYTEHEQKNILALKMNGYYVHTYADFCELYLNKIAIESINDEWLILSKGFDSIFLSNYSRLKRITDIFLAVIGLTISLPLLLIAAVMIKIDSKGSILFSQTRTGKNGKPFTIYKLRTMRQDAEKDGAKWASQNDSRITPVGNFLRKTRIDEIPQMYNVLIGNMSFIGPRPERPEFDRELSKEIPYYMLRYLIKPGLTGWAQVNYGYGASVEDSKMKLKYDLYYIKNYSFFLDLRIIFKTILIVLFRKGR
ncbi:exopolysaccharide biosynthesis polyprenyl glycosylphosphotransferase [Seleniivibrio woodruffii]|uniref:Exopolysaccharide biosynthesis polyprenyl glycosylphosphotransferase n=2 Tax=Seleniivibrio woodruffii TaxID=1078050 RepID=A0A4R1KCT6_9BACT|nr:exopolysaccharide biosynthesis polyprenyl glycosylphosphotransferase [Seleniivibrio woodruffii]TVZ34518.1 exopolysaccharide biosynthesis polyprenyl glycosylphosphotransferase [Seleniivibrio woodruffii]